MKLSETRQGELFMLAESVLGGAFPVIAVIAYNFVSPLVFLALGTFLATLFFAVLMAVQKKWHEIFQKNIWPTILWVALLNGVFYYAIYFMALKYTSAGNVAIISETELLFSFIFFGLILRKEKYTKFALLGSALMFIGAVLVIFSGSFTSVNIGDFLILFISIVIPAGNYFQQKVRKYVSATTLLFLRNLIAFPFVLLLTLLMSEIPTLNSFISIIPLVLISGIMLFGLAKIFWIEAIHRISVAKARAIATITPIFALFYVYLFLGEAPTIWQLAGLVPITIGVILITSKSFLHEPPAID